MMLRVSFTFAQTPNGFNYQALARDAAGDIIVNTAIGVQFDLRETTAAGTIIYTETHTPITNANGVFNLVFGQGTPTTGVFNTIDWANDAHFLEVSIDPAGGTTYVSIGTTPLLSVPYALHAKTAANVSGLETIDEGNGNGLVKIGRTSENYGDIGLNSIDLSHSVSVSNINGATGDYSTAIGRSSEASGFSSTAMGYLTDAKGNYSTAIGRNSIALGENAVAMGFFSNASGNYSTAMGYLSRAEGAYSTAIGRSSIALGESAVAMGYETNALGYFSTAIGRKTTADAHSSTVLGRNNIGGGSGGSWVVTDPLFEIGNGTISNKSNALTVLKNGTITAPTFDLAEITDDKALITKEYLDGNIFSGDYNDLTNQPTNATPTGLEVIDEGNGNGLAIIGRDPANYGSVGLGAIDLSFSGTNLFPKGATGDYSTAIGENTTASGEHSTALGRSTTAAGNYATAMGNGTTASGEYSTAMGSSTVANSYASLAMGRYNIGNGTIGSWVGTDPLFEIGNGSSFSNKSNALTVLKNGTITAPTFSLAEIDTAGDKALITKQYADANYIDATFSGDYNDLSSLPSLFSGDYNDLTNTPTVEADTVLILEPGYSHEGGNFGQVTYYKNNERVYLEGSVLGTSIGIVGYLPVGYRPSKRLRFNANTSNGIVRVEITIAGVIRLMNTPTSWFSLSDVSFRAGN